MNNAEFVTFLLFHDCGNHFLRMVGENKVSFFFFCYYYLIDKIRKLERVLRNEYILFYSYKTGSNINLQK